MNTEPGKLTHSTNALCRRILALAVYAPDSDYEAGSIVADVRKALDAKDAEIAKLRGLLVFDRDAFSALQFAFPPSDSRRAELRERARYIDAALQEPTRCRVNR